MKKNKIIEKANENRKEFFDFIKSYNVIQLSIGVVLGNAVKDLTTSMVNNLFMPLIGMFSPSGQWKELSVTIAGSKFGVGNIIASLVDFIIVALVIYVVIKKILKIELDNAKK